MTYEAVVLSAGRSSRAGSFKPALDCRGMPLVVRVVRAFAGVCRRVWVVTGYRGEEVAELLQGEPGVSIVANPDWEQGMFSSVRKGVSQVESDRFFITPGDLPMIGPHTVQALVGAEGTLVVPSYRGLAGHPILLARSHMADIHCAAPSMTLRDVLAGVPRTVVPSDAGVLKDIDTYQDYEDYQRRFLWAPS